MTDLKYTGKKDKNKVDIKIGDTLKLTGDVFWEDEDEYDAEDYLDTISPSDYLVDVIGTPEKPLAEIHDRHGNALNTVTLEELDEDKIEVVVL